MSDCDVCGKDLMRLPPPDDDGCTCEYEGDSDHLLDDLTDEQYAYVQRIEAENAALQARIAELEKDRERLEFMLEGERFIDTHVITGRKIVSEATSMVPLKYSKFAPTARDAIDAAMQTSGAPEERSMGDTIRP